MHASFSLYVKRKWEYYTGSYRGQKKLKRNIYLVIEWVKQRENEKEKENLEKEIDLYFLCILHPERNENKGWQQRQK